MVTTIRKYTGGTHPFLEFACLSTDTKPVDLVPDNSICHEIDTGKKYYFANKAWHEAPGRGGSEDGGGLPADFPAEGAANANKYIGFDANGDYEAKSAPSGGAEKFVVTLTQDAQTEEWTAADGVTVADIVAAYNAGQIVVASVPTEDLPVEVPCVLATVDPFTVCIFSGAVSFELGSIGFVNVFGTEADGSDSWDVRYLDNRVVPSYSSSNNGQVLGVSSGDLAWVDNYAPLVVTMQNGVGNKTLAEIHAAATDGRPVIFAGNVEGSEFVLYCTSTSVFVEADNTVYQAYYNNSGENAHFEGGASDYPSLS